MSSELALFRSAFSSLAVVVVVVIVTATLVRLCPLEVCCAADLVRRGSCSVWMRYSARCLHMRRSGSSYGFRPAESVFFFFADCNFTKSRFKQKGKENAGERGKESAGSTASKKNTLG